MAISSISFSFLPEIFRQSFIASKGNYFECLILLYRSCSQAAKISPLTPKAAEES